MPITFLEFMDKKQRDAIRELSVVKRILKHGGLQIASHLHNADDDPFLFVYNPGQSPDFGIRIYKLGGHDIYYRPQKKEKTHPWGEAKTLDVKGIFEDITSEENEDDNKAAKEIIKAVCDEVKGYFKAQAKADKDNKKNMADKSPLGSVAVRGSLDTGDFSNVTYGLNNGK